MGLLSAGGWAGVGDQMARMGTENSARRWDEEREKLREERDNRRMERADQMSRDRAQWEVDTLGPKKNQIAADGVRSTEQARHDVKYDPANVEAELAAFKKQAKAKSDSEIEEMIATSKNPGYLKAIRNIALAKHIVSPQIALQPQADGTIMRLDMRTGQALGVVTDPVTNKPMMSPKGLSDTAVALAKSYFAEGEQLFKDGSIEEAQARMNMGRDILMGRPPKEKPSAKDRPPLSTFNK